MHIINWINRSGYLQGVCWIVLSCLFSNLSDILTKYLPHLPVFEVMLFRFGIGLICLLPFVIKRGLVILRVEKYKENLGRILAAFAATIFWIFGVTRTNLATVTAISFCCPLFVLPLAAFFLGEKVGKKRILAVLISFIGVLIVAFSEKGSVTYGGVHLGVVYLLIASILFAISDLFNKYLSGTESMFALLFSYYLLSALLSAIPALTGWVRISLLDWFPLIILGVCGLIMVFCILKAVKATEVSALSPYKYTEMLFSLVFGYCLFREKLFFPVFIGIILILLGTTIAFCWDEQK